MGSEVAIITQPMVPAFSFTEVEKIASAIARGGLFGSKDPYAVLTLCMLAQAEGQHPAVVFRDYDLIQGKPAKKAEAMLRDFVNSGGKVTWNRLDDECADATFSHPQGGTVTINWTMARAQKAQLGGKEMWKKYPRQMLRSRTVSEGVRTVYPGATSGLYVPEEVRDFDATPSDTPATPEPKRARDLKAEQPKQIETDPSRVKAEQWVGGFTAELGTFDANGQRALFAKKANALAKLEREYPDLHAQVTQLLPEAETVDAETGEITEPDADPRQTEETPEVNDEHPGKAIADRIIAEINAPETNAVMDVSTILNREAMDIGALSDADAVRVEIAADKRRAEIRTEQAKAKETAE